MDANGGSDPMELRMMSYAFERLGWNMTPVHMMRDRLARLEARANVSQSEHLEDALAGEIGADSAYYAVRIFALAQDMAEAGSALGGIRAVVERDGL